MPASPLAKWKDVFPNWPNSIFFTSHVLDAITDGPRNHQELDLARYLDALAKIELHVHLEAAVPASFYEKLNSISQKFPEHRIPSRRAPFATFHDFIRGWVDQTLLIRAPFDLEEMALAFFQGRKSQNIVYTEAHISPADFCMIRRRLGIAGPVFEFDECLGAYLRGVRLAQQQSPRHIVRLIVDCLWPSTADEREIFLDQFQKLLNSADNRDQFGLPIIVGIGLGGPELPHEAKTIKPFVEQCRAMGLKIDIHSGEMTTAAEHQLSVETLQPDRVGHGIRGAEVSYFAPCPIVTCPLSNLMTGSWQLPLKDHPLGQMIDRGLNVSIGTDDPLLFGNNLVVEYVALSNAFGWDRNTIHQLQKNAALAAFAPEALAKVYPTP